MHNTSGSVEACAKLEKKCPELGRNCCSQPAAAWLYDVEILAQCCHMTWFFTRTRKPRSLCELSCIFKCRQWILKCLIYKWRAKITYPSSEAGCLKNHIFFIQKYKLYGSLTVFYPQTWKIKTKPRRWIRNIWLSLVLFYIFKVWWCTEAI